MACRGAELYTALDADRVEWLASIGEPPHTMQPFVDYHEQIRQLDDRPDARYIVLDNATLIKAVLVEWPGPPPSEHERWMPVRQLRAGEGYWWRRPRGSWTGDGLVESMPLHVLEGCGEISSGEFEDLWHRAGLG